MKYYQEQVKKNRP